ncbi:MAG: hypothetical protein K0U21_02410 [Proteobacteria bacterium]|nr:hypothetical protein [Pseudomonadota bacterium]
MNKLTIAAFVATGLFVSSNSMADNKDIKSANNQVSLKAISTDFDYTETGDGRLGTKTGTLDTETGGVPGYMLSASIAKDLLFKNDYLGIDFSKTDGHTNYVGSYQGGNYGDVRTTSGAKTTDFSVRYGKSYEVSHSSSLTPYAELGYHEWIRGVNSGETYTHKHYGLGVLAQFAPVSKLVLSANAMIGNTFDSNISINAIDTRYAAFSEGLGNSTITKFGIAADYAFTKNFHGTAGINRTNFEYGAGATVANTGTSGGSYWEPASKTTLTNIELGLGYAF